VIRVYHCTCQYTILERGVDFSPDKRSFVTTHVLATNVHETSLQLRLCIRESRDPRHRIVCVQRRGADAWHDEVLRVARCTRRIVAATRKTSLQSSDLAALLQEFAFHSLMIFHVFSLFFHVALFHGALTHDSFTHVHTTS